MAKRGKDIKLRDRQGKRKMERDRFKSKDG